jgi:apolipoprotein N-acyltransferase
MVNVIKRPLVLSVFGGVLMGSAFLHPFFWWTGVVGLALILYVSTCVLNRAHAFWYGTLSGAIKIFIVGSWVWTVYPFDWIGTFDHTLQFVSIAFILLSTSIVIGSSLGCFAVCASTLMKDMYGRWLLPMLYVGSEILGSIFFSLFAMSPLSDVNAHFSFGYLGYVFAGHGLLGTLALFGGVYTLSALAGFFAVLLVWVGDVYHKGFSLHKRKLGFSVGIILVIFGTYFISIPLPEAESKMTVVAINTNFPHRANIDRSEVADRVRTLIEAFTIALETNSDAIVFPETASALRVFGTKEDIFAYIESHTDRDVVVIDSEQVPDKNGQLTIRASIYDSKTHSVHYAYKNYLVPVGEFLPYSLSAMMALTGFGNTVDMLGSHMTFVPNGEGPPDVPSTLPGVLFCSESVSPAGVLLASHRSMRPFVVHPISHAWFRTPESLWYQLDLMIRTQVRMAHVPLVQASNMWESRAYNSFGFPVKGEVVSATASSSVVLYKL